MGPQRPPSPCWRTFGVRRKQLRISSSREVELHAREKWSSGGAQPQRAEEARSDLPGRPPCSHSLCRLLYGQARPTLVTENVSATAKTNRCKNLESYLASPRHTQISWRGRRQK